MLKTLKILLKYEFNINFKSFCKNTQFWLESSRKALDLYESFTDSKTSNHKLQVESNLESASDSQIESNLECSQGTKIYMPKCYP